VGAMAARHLLDLFDFFAGYGPELDVGISRVSEDSAKAGVAFFAFLGLFLIAHHRSKIFWGLLIAVPALSLIAAYGTRMIWIEFIVSIPIILAVIPIKRALIVLSAAVIVVAAGSGFLYVANQASAERVYDRFQYITEGRDASTFAVDVDYNMISRIDPIRYAEILNVVDTMNDRKSWLWGNGYGGYYNDNKVDFPVDLKSTFPQYSLDSNKFYRTHNYFSQFFHKYGLIGVVLASLIWLLPVYLLIRILRRHGEVVDEQPDLMLLVMLTASVFSLTSMIEMTWSGKGYFLNGLLVVLIIDYVVRQRSATDKTWGRRMTAVGNWLR
jgi:O-antigen ligase